MHQTLYSMLEVQRGDKTEIFIAHKELGGKLQVNR